MPVAKQYMCQSIVRAELMDTGAPWQNFKHLLLYPNCIHVQLRDLAKHMRMYCRPG